MEVVEEAVGRIRNAPEIIGGRISIAFGIACAEGKDQVGDAVKLSVSRQKCSEGQKGA